MKMIAIITVIFGLFITFGVASNLELPKESFADRVDAQVEKIINN